MTTILICLSIFALTQLLLFYALKKALKPKTPVRECLTCGNLKHQMFHKCVGCCRDEGRPNWVEDK